MATNTTNYNFKKPDESDFYSVQDQNNNWDKADAALKDLDTPTFEDYSGSTTVPDAATAINNIRSKGKLSTILSNMKAAFKGACLIGQIVNNCVTNNAKLPLSAAQGKALMDLYTQLNSDLENRVINNNINQKIKIGWTGTAAPLIVNDSYKGDFALKSDLGEIQIKSVLTIYKSGISITAGENTYVSLPYTKTYNTFPLVIVKSAVHCIVNIVDIKTDTVDVRLEGIKTDADGQVYLYVLEI